MNSHIINSFIDIEHRIQAILDDLGSIREQVFYTYDPNESNTEDLQDAQENERQASFEFLVTNDK